MKLLIAIPVLNEELSIEAVIERSLAAREVIIACSPITEVEITVVSDGSTDRTVALASTYADRVNLIVFEENKGYGAAIKEAWRRSDAEVLGFLDGDGTCDPEFFCALCNRLEQDGADVVLGCRMNAESEMPALRRLGNTVFACMLTAFSTESVRDTASGMRVVRRSSLPKLMPLPDGLHFTPAMTARAILGHGLKLSEIDMPYRERAGQSKLRVGRDGVRFLKVILSAVSLYRPSRLFAALGMSCVAVAGSLTVGPTLHYVRTGTLQEWMIYRLIISDFAGASACLLFCAGHITRRVVDITLFTDAPTEADQGPLRMLLQSRWFWLAPVGLAAVGSALVIDSFVQRITTGATYEHWSRFVAMSFLFSTALVLSVTQVIDRLLDLVTERLTYLRSLEAPYGALKAVDDAC